MSDLLQSGYHPDADQLNAFVEHALPDHERQQTLAHLAVCPDCRAIVALSLPPVEVAAPEPFRKSWFSGWNLAWPVVAALAGLVVFFVQIRNTAIDRRGADASGQVAISHPPPAPLQAPANPQASNPKPPPVVSEKNPPIRRREERAVDDVSARDVKPAIDVNNSGAKSLDAKSPEGVSVQDGSVAGRAQGGPALGGASLHGQLWPQAGNASGVGVARMKTPAEAADHFEQPPAGSNAASIVASDRLNEARAVSGIHQGTPSPQAAPVPAAPAPVPAPARADGIVTTNQTVEVAASPTADLSTSNAEVAHPLIGNTILQHPLPSKLPILSMVSSAHRILAIDTNNAVFFSDDDGTTWNAVPAQWRGRAVTVSLVASGTAGTFASHARTATLSATNTPSANLQASQQSQASAALTGTVTDRSGAVIPDASVVVGNSTTPNLRTMKTDRTGHYLIDDLVPGSYRVEVEALGFNKQQLDVSISASQQNLANFTLIVGNATQTVSVEAAAEPRVTLSVPKKKDAARTSANQQQAVFEMTTDTGDRWTSADGHIWKHQ